MIMATLEPTPTPATTAATGIAGRCPRCGKGQVFRRGLVVAQGCDRCGLDYAFINTGDGPAVFAIFILGFFVLGGALIAEFKFGVSPLFHVITWGLLTPAVAFVLLRGLKGLLIYLQYRNKAEEGRRADR